MNDHTTTIRTDFAPSEIIVRGDDGRWFRVLNWLNDSGIWAALPANQKAVMWPLHRHRQPSGLMVQPLSLIGREAGLGRSATYDAIQGLLAHSASLLARHGSALIVLPGRDFAGRASATADAAVRDGGRFSATADAAVPPLRALRTNQPKDKRQDSKPDQTKEETPDARARLLVGWKGLGQTFRLADHARTPREALAMLRVGEPRLSATADLARLTIAEIEAIAIEVRADPEAQNKPLCLSTRLFYRRGLLPPADAQTTRRIRLGDLIDDVHRLERIRLQKGAAKT